MYIIFNAQLTKLNTNLGPDRVPDIRSQIFGPRLAGTCLSSLSTRPLRLQPMATGSKVNIDRGTPMAWRSSHARKNLKLTVLSPTGHVWTMVAGGGASVIYSDLIAAAAAASGFAFELAN
ncbi:uncharacterized protein F5891DRAFT_983367 [Suillus fuscotomentosus]|uniref:ATP-citrate synthase citrate-binding domain-containing protein n=1 Tax=Suillus fuscotomentosus TaxID=1912939 RepID=A0AAD4E151_9AGAM|nr:uncharacterized protein F5891DRAFT_983367 [Suillus fuscotomentosus]KAG1896554.1 hypothetical protein F5891DRAFT_983367 [Suillus fuscotomentosus]